MINLLLSALLPTRAGDDPGQPRGYTGRHRHSADRSPRGEATPEANDWNTDTNGLVSEPA